MAPPVVGKAEARIDRRYACYRLRIARSRIHRLGVYACERIPSRRKVIEYTGEPLNRKQTRQRALAALMSKGRKLIYVARLDSYWALDGSVGGSGAQYVNHSCDPNLQGRVIKGRLWLVSRREIAAGKELTIDYRLGKGGPTVRCRCGSRNCRGTLNVT